MEAKTFYSRLFKRKINPGDQDFWQVLYAELLHRLREIDDRNCFCHYCDADKAKFNSIIADMENDNLIEENEKPKTLQANFPSAGSQKKGKQKGLQNLLSFGKNTYPDDFPSGLTLNFLLISNYYVLLTSVS